jgi:hypothetical protein
MGEVFSHINTGSMVFFIFITAVRRGLYRDLNVWIVGKDPLALQRRKGYAVIQWYFFFPYEANVNCICHDCSWVHNITVNLLFSKIRMDYELILKEILGQGERQPLPQLFLMEMLVVNEKLMQFELAPDAVAIAKLREQLNGLEQQLCSRIQPVIDMYLAGNATVGDVVQLKEFYVSRKYLLRIIERLSTFASRDQVV